MKKDKISVIVPVYNVEKYIEKCILSLQKQTYENLEIILVDDGSPDHSGKIIDEYAKKDGRIKVIHKENGGLSDARNAGILVAEGEYIAFLDSDDYIHEQMYEKLYEALAEQDAQMAICNFQEVNENGEALESNIQLLKDEQFNKEKIFKRLAGKDGVPYVVAWNKLYKRDLFDTVKYPYGKIHEDEYVAHMLYDQCSKIVTIPDTLYYYVRREGSITSGNVSVKRLDVVWAIYNRYVFLKENQYDSAAKAVINSCYGNLVRCMRCVSVKENKKSFCNAIKTLVKTSEFGCVSIIKLWGLFFLKCMR